MQVESTEEKIYIKIPEGSVDLATVLMESGRKLGEDPEELVVQVSSEGKGR